MRLALMGIHKAAFQFIFEPPIGKNNYKNLDQQLIFNNHFSTNWIKSLMEHVSTPEVK